MTPKQEASYLATTNQAERVTTRAQAVKVFNKILAIHDELHFECRATAGPQLLTLGRLAQSLEQEFQL